MTKKNILFDLYGVLLQTQSEQAVKDIETVVKGDQSIWPIFWSLRGPLDAGRISDEEFWTKFQEETGLHDFDIQDAVEVDYSGWMNPDPEMIEYVGTLVDQGYRIGLLSNIPKTLAQRVIPQQKWLESFHSVTLSCDIGYAKPDKQAFIIACQNLGVEPEDTLFFDDSLTNVEAARAAGLQAFQFISPQSVKDVLS